MPDLLSVAIGAAWGVTCLIDAQRLDASIEALRH